VALCRHCVLNCRFGEIRTQSVVRNWCVATGDQHIQDLQALHRHYHRHHPVVTRKQDQIDVALDGFYALRTPVPAHELDATGVVTAYKNLKYVERDFRHSKARRPGPAARLPAGSKNASGARADLHARLLPHLAPTPRLGPAHLHRPGPAQLDNPVAAARRSAAAQAKASYQHDQAGQPYRSSRGLPEHLATLTRNQVRCARHPDHHHDAHRADQHPAAGLRAHRHPDPADLDVARTPTWPTR
jgi:hypothetical protein